MTICKKCGKEHGLVLEDMTTGETTPMDVCKDCMFYTSCILPKKLSDNEVIIISNYAKLMREIEDQCIRDMVGENESNPMG